LVVVDFGIGFAKYLLLKQIRNIKNKISGYENE